jgi:lipid II:glycine glycyltransferase (peptidoglycan interpeptide bridge formation enzyme)
VDLEKTENDLLASMSPKCRYNIRLATKHGVRVLEEYNSIADYLKLMFGKTTKRQKIYSHSEIYHEKLWDTLYKQNIAKMFCAKYENKIIACWIIFCWRDFIYYAYGAFDDDYKNLMAPVLGLWEIIKWGKRNGFKTLDLWGAEEGKGFSRFKEQFGPTLVEMVGSYDLPINGFMYKFFRIFEEIRWKILRAIK